MGKASRQAGRPAGTAGRRAAATLEGHQRGITTPQATPSPARTATHPSPRPPRPAPPGPQWACVFWLLLCAPGAPRGLQVAQVLQVPLEGPRRGTTHTTIQHCTHQYCLLLWHCYFNSRYKIRKTKQIKYVHAHFKLTILHKPEICFWLWSKMRRALQA